MHKTIGTHYKKTITTATLKKGDGSYEEICKLRHCKAKVK